MKITFKSKRLTVVLVAVALIFGSVAVATPAYADSSLCVGTSFSTCINAGHTAHGYEAHYLDNVSGSGVGYWKSYNGHNCTNYVGYMLTQNGDSGHSIAMGNATRWDNTIAANPSWGYVVNTTPAAGSIAQWEGNDSDPNSSPGHVAYVESVNANGSIIVSEDNVYPSGDLSGPASYRWRTITTGGDWPTRFLHIKDLVSTSSTGRLATLGADGTAFAKDSLYSPWVNVLDGVAQMSVSANRIGLVGLDGVSYVKEGSVSSPLVSMLSGVKQIEVTDTRIGVLATDGTLYVKEGAISSSWITVMTGVAKISLSGDRIGIVATDGTAYVKVGSISSGWVNVYSGVSNIDVSPSRVGILTNTGSFLVKDGSIYTAWVTVENGATWISVSDATLGTVLSSGTARVKEGSIYSSWVNVLSGVSRISVYADHIGVLATDGTAFVKEGGASAPWVTVNNGVADLKLIQ